METLNACAAKATVPLEGSEATAGENPLVQRMGFVDPRFELVDCASAVAAAAPLLTSAERAVIAMSFGGDLSQKQIARELGYSRSHVGRLLHSGLGRLRAQAA